MSLFPLFERDDELPAQASRLAPKLRALAEEGIYFGTSSWKYEGWLGSIYTPERYFTRGKFSRQKFEAECLAEYALTFPVVCGDFAFYQFPDPAYWKRLFESTPSSLLFAFKVPEDITVARWPTHARYGARGGHLNEAFLDADAFRRYFTERLEPYAGRVATLIFEFGTFPKAAFPAPEAFYDRIEAFLSALPGGFSYAIEIRNKEYLRPEYFSLLAEHNTAHVLNAWTRMPTLETQLELPGSFTAGFTVVRALLSKGRSYENAVKALSPYELVREADEPSRSAMRRIAQQAREERKKAYVFVNNRLEGNAPTTIEAVVERLSLRHGSDSSPPRKM